jgi:predicted GIY-YIG superfamily endonuclease
MTKNSKRILLRVTPNEFDKLKALAGKRNINQLIKQLANSKQANDAYEKSNKNYTVYMIQSKSNGKRYIGYTTLDSESCFQNHIVNSNPHGSKIQKAMFYEGRNGFEYHSLQSFKHKHEAKVVRLKLIKQYDSFNNGYNSKGKQEYEFK